MRHVIITGASKGLGKALAIGFSKQDTYLILFARGSLDETRRLAEANGAKVDTCLLDFSDINHLEERCETVFSEIRNNCPGSIYLINNAALLDPVGPSFKNETELVKKSFLVNAVAPLVFTNLFIKHFVGLPFEKRIVNITSGAAAKPVYGWSCYCSSKAALDMVTFCTSLEQEEDKNLKIISINPGVMNTAMQEKIRRADREDFPDQDRYIRLFEKRELPEPETVASKIIQFLNSDNFRSGDLLSIDGI